MLPQQLWTQQELTATRIELQQSTMTIDLENKDKSNNDTDMLDNDDIELDLSNMTHMNLWVELLLGASSANTEDIYENIIKESVPTELETQSICLAQDKKDECKAQPVPLPELPMKNGPHYSQEYAAYFQEKKYVHNDKYSLDNLVSYVTGNDNCTFPENLTGYKEVKTFSTW